MRIFTIIGHGFGSMLYSLPGSTSGKPVKKRGIRTPSLSTRVIALLSSLSVLLLRFSSSPYICTSILQVAITMDYRYLLLSHALHKMCYRKWRGIENRWLTMVVLLLITTNARFARRLALRGLSTPRPHARQPLQYAGYSDVEADTLAQR
jgi:hypothetical protein